MTTPVLSPSFFPDALPSYRDSRYGGDGVDVALARFGDEDRVRLQTMYEALRDLLAVARPLSDENVPGAARNLEPVRLFARSPMWRAAIDAARQLGRGTGRIVAITDDADSAEAAHLRKAIHDVRGGAFQAVAMVLQLVEFGMNAAGDPVRLFYLTRDQLKIIRNAIPDLDPPAYRRDMEGRLHDMGMLVQKWASADHRLDDATHATVRFASAYDGPVAERCIEFAALDRVVYNTVNNAVRHTADGLVDVNVAPVGALDAPTDLRFVIANQVSPAQRATLEEKAAEDRRGLGALFAGGFTTSGTGLGLSICAEFVQNAYGLSSLNQVLDGRYAGATLADDRFTVWFHWPTAA